MAVFGTRMSEFKIGVDIGGTFTDVVLWDVAEGQTHNAKLLTTPDDPSRAVQEGVRRILDENGVSPGSVVAVIHGTTLVANALIERKGVQTGLITTRGFRDVLEIGREWRYDLFDLGIEMPEPIADRPLRAEITERISADGTVLTPLAIEEIEPIVDTFHAAGVTSVGVCLLHAYRNAEHELAVRERLAVLAPDLSVSLSSDVSAEMGEYERSSTTVADAYVRPIFRTYVERLSNGLKAMGVGCELLLILSDGRTVRHDTATEFPIRLVQSGPAAGAQAAVLYGGASGECDLLCFDMGGTTAKACLIENAEPQRSSSFEVARVFRFAEGSGLPLQIPAIDMIEIGAGGGSIARVDRLGLIRVGPDSAGANPGPACYGRGGNEPTVTDADLVLGYLDPESFLGGGMALDRDAAVAAIRSRLAEPLGISVEAAAWGMHETVTGNMAQAAMVHAIEKGLNIARFRIVPIGGAGPVHACSLARKMGVDRLICPPGAGVASAIGMLGSPISCEFAQTRMSSLESVNWPAVAAMTEAMAARGQELVLNAGVDEFDVEYAVTMRYIGQGYEVEVPLDGATIRGGDMDAAADAFAECYRRRFGRTEDMPAEVVTWRVAVGGERPALLEAFSGTAEALQPVQVSPSGQRPVWFDPEEGYRTTPVFPRGALSPGAILSGPAIVEEMESTLILPPMSRAEIDAASNIIVTID